MLLLGRDWHREVSEVPLRNGGTRSRPLGEAARNVGCNVEKQTDSAMVDVGTTEVSALRAEVGRLGAANVALQGDVANLSADVADLSADFANLLDALGVRARSGFPGLFTAHKIAPARLLRRMPAEAVAEAKHAEAKGALEAALRASRRGAALRCCDV